MRKNEVLTFNGISLSDYNCFYDGSQLWRKPEKMVDYYSVLDHLSATLEKIGTRIIIL